MNAESRRLPVALGLLLILATAGGCDRGVSVATTSDELEANRIVVELLAQGMHGVEKRPSGDRRNPGWEIVAPAEAAQEARITLVALGLPRPDRPGLAEALESGGVLPSAVDDRMRLMHALGGELERTLLTYDGVVEARVLLAIPESPGAGLLDRSREPLSGVTATVVIKHLEGGDGSAGLAVPSVDEVRQIAAQSVQGLAVADVHVAMTLSRVGSAGVTPVSGIADADHAADRDLLGMLYGALALFGVVILVLVWRLRAATSDAGSRSGSGHTKVGSPAALATGGSV
ncbi:MAG: hypothetical protein AAF288_12810 [Planctomycetota bacterium]